MTSAESFPDGLSRRPKRVDARRNYDALIAAGRDAFAESGTAASLEDVARRAQVGIGTLYRHFPTRADLVEGIYLEEVEAMCRAADELAGSPSWDALAGWLHRFVGYAITKRALAEELARDSAAVRSCRTAIYGAVGPLLERAQREGTARPDVSVDDVLRLVSGITLMAFPESNQIDRIVDIALDGVRRRPLD